MRQDAGKKNSGFTLVELIVSVAILTVMVGFGISGMMKTYRSARENKYKLETVAVFQAMQMYLMDQGGMSDEIYDAFFEEMIRFPVSDPRHALQPYLSGNVTKGTWIYYLGAVDEEFIEMGYLIDGYVIVARIDGTVYIETYPGPDSPNPGDH